MCSVSHGTVETPRDPFSCLDVVDVNTKRKIKSLTSLFELINPKMRTGPSTCKQKPKLTFMLNLMLH